MEAIVFQEFLMVSAISTAMNKKVLEGSYNIMFIRLPGKLLDYAVGWNLIFELEVDNICFSY